MKHHFGDLLDREGDYWTVVPNRERFAFDISQFTEGCPSARIVTIEGDNGPWRNVFTFPNLEELTLHGPSEMQLSALVDLPQLKRLRITHAQPKEIGFLRSLSRIEELVFEYVSGFSDLSPLQALTNLKSVHLENLRRVSDFGGLSGIASLRYLAIDGTLDWKQPIANFEFARGLPNLEVISFGFISCKAVFPATLPLLSLKCLKKLKLPWNMLTAEEYALLEVSLPDVKGTSWGPYIRLPYSATEEWFVFTGKGAGRTKCGHPQSEQKCAEYAAKYERMKTEALVLLKNFNT